MAEQLKSGKWMAKRVIHSTTKMQYFDTKQEAVEWENG